MSKYLNIYFSNKENPNLEQQLESTNELVIKPSSNYYIGLINSPDVYKFSYRLRDTITTEKFKEVFEEVSLVSNKNISYNIYETRTIKSIKEIKNELNDLIDYINTKKYFQITDSLKVDIEATRVESKKLNTLNQIFEEEKALYVEYDDTDDLDIYKTLNKLNQLITKCKHNSDIDKRLYQVFRIYSKNSNPRTKMTEVDYNQLGQYEFGTLHIDYGIVGKDLYECYITNDIELIKSKQASQQEYIIPWISTSFMEGVDDEQFNRMVDDYHTWCEINEVTKYGYDYTKPMFNIGRLVIGDLVDKENHTLESILDIKQKLTRM